MLVPGDTLQPLASDARIPLLLIQQHGARGSPGEG